MSADNKQNPAKNIQLNVKFTTVCQDCATVQRGHTYTNMYNKKHTAVTSQVIT